MNNQEKEKKAGEKTEAEMTIKEMEEALKRKKLSEALAKKANKQTRDFDESMLGVCQTCHVPIYQGSRRTHL